MSVQNRAGIALVDARFSILTKVPLRGETRSENSSGDYGLRHLHDSSITPASNNMLRRSVPRFTVRMLIGEAHLEHRQWLSITLTHNHGPAIYEPLSLLAAQWSGQKQMVRFTPLQAYYS
ncbi:hypothetical protein CEXT_450181 [Caerostris extrusa]|uniref:Uncharacterized protein n=1 Tax=Caerostris extrusa TaxID=172846 RepID=A0AAV4XNQ7_CAEEX|nr:hypothetical protein CEXT_450181 [Caerostris extrusa]